MPATIFSPLRLHGSWIAQGLTVICGVLLSLSTVAAFSAEITVDPAAFAANQTFARDSLSPDWFNGPNHILQHADWTTNRMNYLVADDSKNFILKSRSSARDMEVDTWVQYGYVYLRLAEDGTAIFFEHVGVTERGWLTIGILTGVGENFYEQGTFRHLYNNHDLLGTIPDYRKFPTDGDYFTFGVEGFDIYAKFNGKEFLRFKEYRHMKEGRAAFKGNVEYGIRKTTLRLRETPKPLFSDYQKLVLDLRDFGLRSLQAVGSIDAGSNQLRLQSAPNPPFQKSDYVIVELGGEAGRGLRGTMGVGGTWPAKRYPNAATRDADRSQALNTFAWIETDGTVRQWDGTRWYDPATWTNTAINPPGISYNYYMGKAVPLALRTSITEISPDGTILTLSTNAKAGSINANVYLDNALFLDKLARTPLYDGEENFPNHGFGGSARDFTSITPTGVTLSIPPGDYAFGEMIFVNGHPGWQLTGAGANRTRLFSPKGVPSMGVTVDASPDVVLRDFHLEGNARNHGYGLNVQRLFTEFNNGVTETTWPQGANLPPGVLFHYGSNRGRAENLKLTDLFPRAAGASFSDDVWVENCHLTLTEGQRSYIQWPFLWSDARGGGCTNCSLWSPELVAGFASFKSTGTQFLNCAATNGVFSSNGAGDFLFRNIQIVVLPGSQPADRWFSEHSPLVNINNNINDPTYLAQGGRLENVTMLQTGYINGQNDLLNGININDENRNVVVRGGLYSAPDYSAPSRLFPVALNSTGKNTVVEDFRAIGKTKPTDRLYGNINLTDGIVRNSAADFMVDRGLNAQGLNVQFENNRPNSNVAPVLSAIEAKAAAELTSLTFNVIPKDLNNSTNDTLSINQKLTFSLVAGAPSGATIHPDTGLFSWTPSAAQGGNIYRVTVRVTDSGSPPLSAETTFNVTVGNTPPILFGGLRSGLLADFTQTTAGFQDDFDGVTLNSNWRAIGQSVYTLSNGVLRVRTAQGDVNHLLYAAAGYDPSVQEVLARIRVTNFGTGDGPRAGIGVAVGPDSQGINYHFRDEGGFGRHTEFLDDLRAWGPEFNFKWQNNNWYWMRLRHQPNAATGQPDVLAKVWLADGSVAEPSAWQSWDYVPTRRERSGFAGITAGSSGGISEFEVDYFLVKAAGLPVIQVAPKIAASPIAGSTLENQTINEGTPLSGAVWALDADSPAQILTFSLDPDAPAGALIDPKTGIYTWTPTEAQGPGTYPITVRVTDNGSPPLSDVKTFTVTVTEVRIVPVLSVIPDQVIKEGVRLLLTMTATVNGAPAQDVFFVLGSGAPEGASIDPLLGEFFWTPTEAQGPGVYRVSVVLTDLAARPLIEAKPFTVAVNEVNQAPVLAAISDQSATSGEALRLTITATDADLPANTLSHALEPGAPGGAMIDPATGVLTWTPTTTQAGTTNRISIRITDNGVPPLTDSKAFTVVVPALASVPAHLSVSLLAKGDVRLVWTTAPGRTYTLQRSADLTDWPDLATITATAASLEYVDVGGADAQSRFYRVLQR